MARIVLFPAMAITGLVAACAPAPLYTSSGLHKGAATWGEVPRDARGEPVWTAIRPAPAEAAVRPEPANARSTLPEVPQEGDAEANPMPPKA
jgi:hypothetical protein